MHTFSIVLKVNLLLGVILLEMGKPHSKFRSCCSKGLIFFFFFTEPSIFQWQVLGFCFNSYWLDWEIHNLKHKRFLKYSVIIIFCNCFITLVIHWYSLIFWNLLGPTHFQQSQFRMTFSWRTQLRPHSLYVECNISRFFWLFLLSWLKNENN